MRRHRIGLLHSAQTAGISGLGGSSLPLPTTACLTHRPRQPVQTTGKPPLHAAPSPPWALATSSWARSSCSALRGAGSHRSLGGGGERPQVAFDLDLLGEAEAGGGERRAGRRTRSPGNRGEAAGGRNTLQGVGDGAPCHHTPARNRRGRPRSTHEAIRVGHTPEGLTEPEPETDTDPASSNAPGASSPRSQLGHERTGIGERSTARDDRASPCFPHAGATDNRRRHPPSGRRAKSQFFHGLPTV